MTKTSRALLAAAGALLLAACGDGGGDVATRNDPAAKTPNILFLVLDDVGVDQLPVFGYGGLTPPKTPNIDAIARAGVRFRNTWSMPTCSPTRATFFDGRFPFRTNVQAAILAMDLANSQVSPYEATTPKILKQKGYASALIGKMHLSGSNANPANNPLGPGVMRELGWDYFEGYLDGGPYPIDTTAGGVRPAGSYGCGFVPNAQDNPLNGADSGACYQPTGACTALSTADAATPGLACLQGGGIFDPGQACAPATPAYIDFTRQNGYYTSELILDQPGAKAQVLPPSDPRSRGYRSTMETDAAVRWIRRQAAGQPWMASVGYSAIHTPVQPPPPALLPPGSVATGGYTCTPAAEQRVLTNQMLEAVDAEIGRLLVETGLAARNKDGSLDYRPETTNTAVILVGDNGTYGPSVKAPFNPTRAKGLAYQTGVWVPLVVAGPMVRQPDRDVPHMVNSADLFSLFAELAGIDARQAVPPEHALDAQPVLAYLTQPGQAGMRKTNYTEMGNNITSTATSGPPPCVIPSSNICVEIIPQQGVCEDQSGVWYGPGSVAGPPAGLPNCCAVNDYLVASGKEAVDILPSSQRAIRNELFKLVRFERMNCGSGQVEQSDEFYRINQAAPLPLLDNAPANLLAAAMTPDQQQNYEALRTELKNLVDSHAACPGDGNLDRVVNQADLDNWKRFSTENGGKSSWYDFNHDGVTDEADLAIIRQNLGRDCRPPRG